MILSITIPRKPLTTNHIYGHRKFGKGKFLKPEAVELIELVKQIMKGKTLPYDENIHYVSTEWYVYLTNFYTKTKKRRINKKSGDLDNFRKAIQDAIFRELKIDDAVICDDGIKKRPGNIDTTVIVIRLENLKNLEASVSFPNNSLE